MCSLICHNGIVGGGLYVEDKTITYRTNKLTVDQKYKNLVLPLNEVAVTESNTQGFKRKIFEYTAAKIFVISHITADFCLVYPKYFLA